MVKSTQLSLWISICITGLFLGACGGGGGGNDGKTDFDSDGMPAIPNQPGSIDKDNLFDVIGEMIGPVLDGADGFAGYGPVQPEIPLNSLSVLSRKISQSPKAISSCENNDGSAIITGTPGNDTTMYNNCEIPGGMVLNGAVSFNEVTNTIPNCPWMYVTNVNYMNFEFSTLIENEKHFVIMNGMYNFDASGADMGGEAADDCETITVTVTGDNFEFNTDGLIINISNLSATSINNLETSDYQHTYIAESTSLTAFGRINTETLVPITGNHSNLHPSSGQVKFDNGIDTIVVTISSSEDVMGAVTVNLNGDLTSYSWTGFLNALGIGL